MPRLTRRPDGKLLCRGGKIRPCDCEPAFGCCPTPFAPIMTGDCGNRWRFKLLAFGVNSVARAFHPDNNPDVAIASFDFRLDPGDGSLAGPAACLSCLVARGSWEASVSDGQSNTEVAYGTFAWRCIKETSTRTDSPFNILGAPDFGLTNGIEGRWSWYPTLVGFFEFGAITAGAGRILDSGTYGDGFGSQTVTHSWGVDAFGHGFWESRVVGRWESFDEWEDIVETTTYTFEVETIEPCVTPTPLPIQPCADLRYWVRATPCPGSPFSTPVYALVSPLDPCGVLPVPDTSPRVCVQVDPSSQQFPTCPPGAICITDPIDPDIRDCCQCVEGCESVLLLPGELCPAPPQPCCMTDLIGANGERCCCHDDLRVQIRSARGWYQIEQFGGGTTTYEYRLSGLPQVGTVREIVYTMFLYEDNNPVGFPTQFTLNPGCGWRGMTPFPWEIGGMFPAVPQMPAFFCRMSDPHPVGAEVISFEYLRSCAIMIYRGEWRYLLPGSNPPRYERMIQEFTIVRDYENDPSICGGGCGPTILPGKALPKITTSSGCVGCKKGEGL